MATNPTGTLPPDPDELIVPIRPDTTIDDILDDLKRQGVGDLGDFVDRSLDLVKNKENEAQGDDDSTWVRDCLISDQFIYVDNREE